MAGRYELFHLCPAMTYPAEVTTVWGGMLLSDMTTPYLEVFSLIPALMWGVQGNFFWRIRFELWAPQVPLIIGKTFGEVPGPQRPTVSEPRPAQKLGVK